MKHETTTLTTVPALIDDRSRVMCYNNFRNYPGGIKMPKPVAELYDTLTLTAQQEAYDFMMYLLQKQQNLTETMQKESRKQKRMAALSEFAGSMKETWKDVDALEYQKKLREERTIG